MSDKNENFDGLLGGKAYDAIARLTGYGPGYYMAAAMAVPVLPGMKLLELGCGTASLSLSLAERMRGQGRIVGLDIAPKQLAQARKKVSAAALPIELLEASSAELPFEDKSFDGICASQVIHGLPSEVRDATLRESYRVLSPGGFFALIDWSKPRLGYTAAVWTLSLLGMRHTPNWQGTYAQLFRGFGHQLATDVFLDSLNRCQVFIKP